MLKYRKLLLLFLTLWIRLFTLLDQGKSIYFLRIAFDIVPHSLLLRNLNSMGVRVVANQSISSYLAERSMVEGTYFKESNTLKIYFCDVKSDIAGVSQGSILKPLLFILYINGLRSCVSKAHLSLFADDTSIVVDE